MDTSVINSLKSRDPKFEIIGNDHQILQIMLLPNESIVTLNENIIYCSNNIKAKTINRPSVIDKIKFWMTRIPRELQSLVICNNNTESLEYLGLSRRIGEILTINLDLFPNICFKARNFVAMTNNIEIETMQQTVVVQFPPQEWSTVKTTPILNRFQAIPQNRFLFLQSTGTLIEKELGAQEEIQVKSNCVFAYANTIKLSYGNETNRADMHRITRRDLCLVRAKGPGTIYIESQAAGTNTNVLHQQHKPGSILAVILCIIIIAILNMAELQFI